MKREDFEFAAEIWWQRAKKLIRYAQSEENPYKRRYKAFLLYLIMYQRVRNCTNVYQFLSRAKKPVIFKEGGKIDGKKLTAAWLNENKDLPEKEGEFIIKKNKSKPFIPVENENLEDILKHLRIKYGK